MADDLGTQVGGLFSPSVYRRFFKPRLAEIIAFVKRRTRARVFFHSCGAVYPFIPDLIEMGVDILNPVQVSAAGMGDTAKLKSEFGSELTFWGAIDTQRVLPFGRPEEVRDEVRRRLDDLAPGGGYVMATVHNIQDGVPPENVLAMLDALREYGPA
jgi:uroporphyrinogen decarboxylase